MANIRLPINDEEKANELLKKFLLENKFHMRIIKFDGQMYGRVSGWAYNDISDYEKVALMYLEEALKE